MPLEEVIAGVTFTGFATLPPTIPGLQALGIFGTAGDARNTNRAPGGPTFTNLTNPPTYGTAWATVNSGTQTPTQGIDTGVVETATVRDGGWTHFCVARMLVASGIAGMIGQAVNNSALLISPNSGFNSSRPAVYHSQAAFAFDANTALIDLTGVAMSAWRMYAMSWPAGTGGRAYTIFDVTGGVQKTTNSSGAHAGTAHFIFGQPGNSVPTGYLNCDIAAGGVCTQALTLAQLQTTRTWLTGVLSVRGVTGF